MPKKPSLSKILLIAWLVIATLYVLYGEYSRLNNFVAARAYQTGVRDTVAQIIQQASGDCKAFPVTIDNQGVQLINLACGTQADESQ